MRKAIIIFTAVLMLFGSISIGVSQETIPVTSIQQLNDNTKIDWTDLSYIAEGQGVMPSAAQVPNRALALLRARDYAKMDALANLLMAIEGTTISYDAIGKDYMADVTIRQKIEGFIRNAEMVSYRTEKFEGDTIVTVKMRAKMFGDNSPGGLLLPESIRQSTTQQTTDTKTPMKVALQPDRTGLPEAPAPIKATSIDPNAPDVMASAKPSKPGVPYTGLIIDAMGYNLKRAMSPAIRRADGSLVWDGATIPIDTLLEKGIASYATSVSAAKANSRVGDNPLVIKSVGRAGGAFFCDPIITDADAKILLYENAKSKFLDDANVIIVKDPTFL